MVILKPSVVIDRLQARGWNVVCRFNECVYMTDGQKYVTIMCDRDVDDVYLKSILHKTGTAIEEFKQDWNEES